VPPKKRLKRVLIANRGEIAVRVIRACRELGIESVAVFSDADQHAQHALLADYAYHIGPSPASESYLRGEYIIEVAKEAGCDAIHPGYGFLSESANFARKIEENGLIFVGPSPDSMDLMGDKLSARNTANNQGVPTTPGVFEPISDLIEAKQIANEIGYPVILKAAAGGGGKGMRLVNSEAELEDSFERAVSEVEKSFGDRAVFVEKFIANGKHIEVQVMADSHGNVVHLYERDCSVQRRYQKVIEETPAPTLSDELREEMGEAAVAVAKACNYRSAGTIEFIFDLDENKFYFLEMNTRIQVEHPVTEMVTGIDLVREQLLVAGGAKLSFIQSDVVQRGASIECRIYAEDPDNNFAPSTGRITHLDFPTGSGIRIDTGVVESDEVSRFYDPMLMKLVVWDRDRKHAIERMLGALRELVIVGVTTPIAFHIEALGDPLFLDGSYSTKFIEQMADREVLDVDLEVLAIASALGHQAEQDRLSGLSNGSGFHDEARWRWSQ